MIYAKLHGYSYSYLGIDTETIPALSGYGWMPYEYILNKLTLDFWSLLGMDWVDSKQFGI